MAKLHIFTVDMAFTVDELEELSLEIQEAFRKQGRPKDKVVVVCYGKYLTSFDLEEDNSGAQ